MVKSKLLLKVRNGTRADGKRLCNSCESAQVMRGAAESQEVVYCHALDEVVRMTVIECNRYKDRATPSLHAMGQIAWVLMTDKNQRTIGFVSPQKWRSEKGNQFSNPVDDIEE